MFGASSELASVMEFGFYLLRWFADDADEGNHPVKPLSDAAASHSSERVASRDTSQSKKGHGQLQSGSGHGWAPTRSSVDDRRRRRLTDITLELLPAAVCVALARVPW